MELTIAIALTIFFIVIILIAKASAKSETPEEKGKDGETEVRYVLGDNIENEQYIFHNLLFADNKGNTCQIDHIVINKNGIWVIETKNYSGMIYGNEKEQEWTQVFAYGKEKYKHYNPILQNQTHIYRLSEYLKVKNIFNNVVVFTNNANLDKVKANNVYSINKLPYVITQNTGINLSKEQILLYRGMLQDLIKKSNVTEEEHIKNIHIQQHNIEHNVCPRCGGNLVLRNSQYGQFYGCENYPNCKFTKKL